MGKFNETSSEATTCADGDHAGNNHYVAVTEDESAREQKYENRKTEISTVQTKAKSKATVRQGNSRANTKIGISDSEIINAEAMVKTGNRKSIFVKVSVCGDLLGVVQAKPRRAKSRVMAESRRKEIEKVTAIAKLAIYAGFVERKDVEEVYENYEQQDEPAEGPETAGGRVLDAIRITRAFKKRIGSFFCRGQDDKE